MSKFHKPQYKTLSILPIYKYHKMQYYYIRNKATPKKGIEKMKFKVEKVANMIFVTSDCDTVFRAWDEREFTERKLKNAMNQIQKNYNGKVEFVRTF